MIPDHPFLGPSENSSGTRGGFSLNPDALTPQPSAGGAPKAKNVSDCAMGKKTQVDNPFALAGWMTGRGR